MKRKLMHCVCAMLVMGTLHAKKAIIIGATSGMGRATAKLLAKNGYEIGVTGRRTELLASLAEEVAPAQCYTKTMDVALWNQAAEQVRELINEMGGLDLMLICPSSYADHLPKGSREADERTVDVDCKGFWSVADVAVRHFEAQKHGHLVGISSMSKVLGEPSCPVYSGAKAFVGMYLEGVRNHMEQNKIPVYVTEVIPGWVDVEHSSFRSSSHTYWVTSCKDAARQIMHAIQKKQKYAYISNGQWVIAQMAKIMPGWMFCYFDKNFARLLRLVHLK